jgi:arylsulfatase A-like enzyme
MAERCVVIVVVDGLRADALGSYGNALAQTPFLDQLSAESTLYDFAYCLDPTLESFYRSAVLGKHPAYHYAGLSQTGAEPPGNALFGESARHYLFTDNPAIAEMDLAPCVWSATCSLSTTDSSADSERFKVDEFFLTAAHWLNDRFGSAGDGPALGWVHVSLLTKEPLHTAANVQSDVDSRGASKQGNLRRSDNLIRYLFEHNDRHNAARTKYAALVTRLDDGIRTLFTGLNLDTAASVTFVATGARGCSQGERGYTGTEPPVLHEELLHVPLIVFRTAPDQSPIRVERLVSPLELRDLVCTESAAARQADATVPCPSKVEDAQCFAAATSSNCLLFANSQGDRALRTPGWYMIRSATHERERAWEDRPLQPMLYLKPDDRWEFNEISDRVSQVQEVLDERLRELDRQASLGEPLNLRSPPAGLTPGA